MKFLRWLRSDDYIDRKVKLSLMELGGLPATNASGAYVKYDPSKPLVYQFDYEMKDSFDIVYHITMTDGKKFKKTFKSFALDAYISMPYSTPTIAGGHVEHQRCHISYIGSTDCGHEINSSHILYARVEKIPVKVKVKVGKVVTP